MDLILWRHAEAEDGLDDLARPLTKKGRKQAQDMAEWLSKHLPKDALVMASQAVRSQQTASALTKDYQISSEINPGAHYASILAAAKWPYHKGCVVIVGHQPTLSQVLSFLLAGQAQEWHVKKGSVWWISNRTRQSMDQTLLRAMQAPDLL